MALFSKKDEDPLVLMQKGDYKKAVKIIQARLKSAPGDLPLKIKLAEAYEGMGEKDNAIRVYIDAAQENIAGGGKDKAYALLKKAEKIQPDNQEVRDKLKSFEEKKDAESFSFDIEQDAGEPVHEASGDDLDHGELVALLRPVFNISGDGLYRIAEAFSVRELGDGELLIREGEDGDSLYVIMDGEFDVYIKDFSDSEPVRTLSKGEIVGEVSFLKGVKRTATLKARGAVKVAELGGERARDVLSPYQPLLKILEEILEKRVLDLIARLRGENR